MLCCIRMTQTRMCPVNPNAEMSALKLTMLLKRYSCSSCRSRRETFQQSMALCVLGRCANTLVTANTALGARAMGANLTVLYSTDRHVCLPAKQTNRKAVQYAPISDPVGCVPVLRQINVHTLLFGEMYTGRSTARYVGPGRSMCWARASASWAAASELRRARVTDCVRRIATPTM